MRTFTLSVLLLTSFSTPALAEAPATSAKEPSDLESVVCRRYSVVGSRARKERVCLTKREWVKLQNGVREGMQDYLSKATAGAPRS